MPQVLEALGFPALVAKWRDPARRCSNLDSLLRHSREYEESAFEAGEAATLSGLILYLEHLGTKKLDLCYPPLGHDAVTLTPCHSAKGLEWPVVVLSGLDSSRSPDMWCPVVTGGGQTDADPLAGRTLRSWTWPFGKTDGEFPKMRSGSGLEDRALDSTEGQDRADRDSWHAEVVASGPRAAGGCWHGAIDLLLRLADGNVVIIDHKSAPIRREHCLAKAQQFTGQTDAYREVLRTGGEKVETTWIHFPLAGVMVQFK